jgi:DNA-binding transcriptional regulator YdaS (Cro superfamily)
MGKILLIIEKASDNALWGRVTFDDNLITGQAPSIELLEKELKRVLYDFHALKPDEIRFDIAYDLTAIFEQKKYLNLSEVAVQLGINRSLMAQYASGKKFPSAERAKQIEKTIHELGRDLLKVKIAVNGQRMKQSKGGRALKNIKAKV